MNQETIKLHSAATPISASIFYTLREKLASPIEAVWTTKRKGRHVVKEDLSVITKEIKQVLRAGIGRVWNRSVDIYYKQSQLKITMVFKTTLYDMCRLVLANDGRVPVGATEHCVFLQKLMEAAAANQTLTPEEEEKKNQKLLEEGVKKMFDLFVQETRGEIDSVLVFSKIRIINTLLPKNYNLSEGEIFALRKEARKKTLIDLLGETMQKAYHENNVWANSFYGQLAGSVTSRVNALQEKGKSDIERGDFLKSLRPEIGFLIVPAPKANPEGDNENLKNQKEEGESN